MRAAAVIGLQRVLPVTLIVTFVLVPSTSTRLFKTFLCDKIEFGVGEQRRYLHDDLSLNCNHDDYSATRTVAIAFIIVWPVGYLRSDLEPQLSLFTRSAGACIPVVAASHSCTHGSYGLVVARWSLVGERR